MNEAVKSQMESLRDRIGAETMAEVVRRALAVFDYVVEERESGAKILVERDGNTTEIAVF